MNSDDGDIRPQAGPQSMAAKSKARILVYGGGAGGGKSWLAAWRAAKYVNVKGYNAAIFRRTFTMLEGSGSIIDETQDMYPLLGGKMTQRPLEWRFPPYQTRVEFRHLQHEDSAKEHKSKQYAFINFDEASDFVGGQFFFMNSRLRTMSGVPKQFLLSTNPDPDCYLRSLLDWWIGEDGFPRRERCGKVRFWVRMKDEIVWADSPDDLVKYVDGDPDSVMSMTFIPALVHDNRKLLDADPSYLANLKSLPAIEQARYLGGNWNAKESAGDYFQKSVFRIWGATELQRALNQQDGKAAEIVQKCRIWDFAATPVTGNLVPGIQRSGEFKARDPRLDDPDWTVSVLLGRTRNGRIIILDTTFHRDTPGAVQALVERMAIQDGPTTTVGIFSEPAQAGVDQSERVRARVKAHAPCDIIATANKEYVAREAARAVWRGEICYLESAVNDRFWNQLHDFPTPKKKDDAVVAFAFAYQWMQQHPAPFYLAPKVEELWVPPNVDKLAMYPPRERARRGAVIVPIGGTRGFARRNW